MENAPGVTGEVEPTAQRLAANAAWLVLLRWVAVIGQLLTIGVASLGLSMPLPLKPLIGVILITAASNLVFAWWVRRHPSGATLPVGHGALAVVMATDIVLLTALLYFAGGNANPFSVFYLVNLTLGAVLLSERWGWWLTGVVAAGMGCLLALRADRPELFAGDGWVIGEAFSKITLGQIGQIIAIVACALVIIHFVSRVTHQLERTAAELRRVERDRSRSERLEALGTLAGGAAHELATPLSTIAVVAKEMLRALNDLEMPAAVREDVSLIRSEVDHCQAILQRMTGRAGRWMAEEHSTLSLGQLIKATLDELHQARQVQVSMSDQAEQVRLSVPCESLAQVLRGLLQNGLDATDGRQPIRWIVRCQSQQVQLTIEDDGPGMPPDVLVRVGEPFYTTKEPGRGMGLGLFLARSVIERLGGQLVLDSSPGRGTTAVVILPRDCG